MDQADARTHTFVSWKVEGERTAGLPASAAFKNASPPRVRPERLAELDVLFAPRTESGYREISPTDKDLEGSAEFDGMSGSSDSKSAPSNTRAEIDK